MQFTLTYQGQLKANGDKQHKHAIRTSVHQQLSVLWQQHPLVSYRDKINNDKPASERILRNIGEFAFAPLILQNKATVELRLTLLRAERDGAIFTTGGDIDNRLKTLFDALRMPRTLQELPNDWSPKDHEQPFFCLTEDDSLITRVNIAMHQWLAPTDPSHVSCMLHVNTHNFPTLWDAFPP